MRHSNGFRYEILEHNENIFLAILWGDTCEYLYQIPDIENCDLVSEFIVPFELGEFSENDFKFWDGKIKKPQKSYVDLIGYDLKSGIFLRKEGVASVIASDSGVFDYLMGEAGLKAFRLSRMAEVA